LQHFPALLFVRHFSLLQGLGESDKEKAAACISAELA
jgi:hypothetical protein